MAQTLPNGKQFTVSGSVAGIDSNFPPEHLHHLIRVLAGLFRPAGTFVALPPGANGTMNRMGLVGYDCAVVTATA